MSHEIHKLHLPRVEHFDDDLEVARQLRVKCSLEGEVEKAPVRRLPVGIARNSEPVHPVDQDAEVRVRSGQEVDGSGESDALLLFRVSRSINKESPEGG